MLNIMIGFAALIIIGSFTVSAMILTNEKKERQRKGITDYYDIAIVTTFKNTSKDNKDNEKE